MANDESKRAGDSAKPPPQVASSVPARKPASTAPERNRGDTLAKRASGPRELPPRLGRYRIIKKLGGGGMGTVYLVENTELEREEALKVPHFGEGDDPQLRERFLREAKSAAKLDHANLCPVYDAGVQDGFYYLTMRFLQGKLLSEYTGKAQPARKAVEIVTKLAQALEAAHGKGVIHRDLKPSNVMMVDGAGPVVMDFGLAKQIQADQKLTKAGSMLGTPAYMPPEQVSGDLERMGPASDVYSLGVILYQLLTGRLPFEGPRAAIFGQILYTEPPLPSALVPGLSPALDRICRKAMAKSSTERYPSMKALAAALMDFLRSTPAREGAANLAPAAGDKAAGLQAPPPATSPPPAGKAAISQGPAVVAGSLAAAEVTSRTDRTTTAEPSVRARRARKGKRRRPAPLPLALLIGSGSAVVVVLVGLVGLWAGGVFRVKTREGILVVAVNQPNSDVYVDGQQVTVTWGAGGQKAEIAVKPGTHQVEVKKAGFTAAGKTVTLSDGGRTLLTASLNRLPPDKPFSKTDLPRPPTSASPEATSGEPKDKRAARAVVGVQPEPLDCTPVLGAGADGVRRAQEAWAGYLGRDVEANVDIADGVTMTFVLVPPGKFLMGSPPNERGKNGRYPNETMHEVTLTEPFDLGKYEVTQAQYAALTERHPSFYKGPDRPVEQVNWKEADAFGRLLTTRLSDRHVYRLATEAEWEYSCRGGRPSSQPFGVGDGRSLAPGNANFNNRVGQTSKVGSYAANALGLHDMHGNVWEWCADWNEPYPNGAVTNPFRATGGPFRVARGGCHNEPAAECRSALRQGSPEERRDCWMGFRLARSLPAPSDPKHGQ